MFGKSKGHFCSLAIALPPFPGREVIPAVACASSSYSSGRPAQRGGGCERKEIVSFQRARMHVASR